MPILAETARIEYTNSTIVNAPLAAIIARAIAQNERQKRLIDEKARIEMIDAKLSPATLRAVHQARE